MKINVIGLVVIIAWTAFTLDCPVYKCETPTAKSGEICAAQSIDVVKMKVCEGEDLICPAPAGLDEESLCTPKKSAKILLPGEYCEESAQCLSGNCNKDTNLCVGHASNTACMADEDCDVGLYCKGAGHGEGVCMPVAPKDANCTADTKCDPNTFCYKGKCTLLAQLDEDEEATVPAACKTYYIKGGKCKVGPVLDSESKECPADNMCVYRLGEEKVTEPCVCGKTETGKGLCRPGKGEASLEDVRFCLVGCLKMSEKNQNK